MRIMAVDYGDARTGIAVSDALGILSGDAFIITERSPERTAEKIAFEASPAASAASCSATRKIWTVRSVPVLKKRNACSQCSATNTAWTLCSGTNGARLSTPNAFCPMSAFTAKNAKESSTPSRPR